MAMQPIMMDGQAPMYKDGAANLQLSKRPSEGFVDKQGSLFDEAMTHGLGRAAFMPDHRELSSDNLHYGPSFSHL